MNAIVWNDYGVPIQYPMWPNEWRQKLSTFYNSITNATAGEEEYTGLPEAPPLATTPNSNESAVTHLSYSDAQDYFMAYVAQSLAAEFKDWLPWSVTEYTADQLDNLFNSNSLFKWNENSNAYKIIFGEHGQATPGDPFRIYAFLEMNDLIRDTSVQAIARLLDWSRDHLIHSRSLGDMTAGNAIYYWQYEGFPPVERMLSGTDVGDGYGVRHWTSGCWGTTAFLRTVLRTINIPVTLEIRCSHAMPFFVREGLYLTHGDDVLGSMVRNNTSLIMSEEMLINQTIFNAWFGYSLSYDEQCNNVGRRVVELVLQYLPMNLLWKHCQDLNAGRDHASSDVYNYFKRYYTLEALETADLWNRMDNKIASLGGCNNITYY